MGDPSGVAPSAEEIAYLCNVANAHFRERVSPADVVWSFAGVRSLYDDGSRRAQDVSRDYVLSLDQREAPLLTVYGGKITTYRRLAEQAIDRIAHIVKGGPAWTKGSYLPGGDFRYDGFEALLAQTRQSRPFLTEEHALRLVRAYGTRAERVLGPARSFDDLGPCMGADLTAAEVRYLMEQEWAQTADDVLWRRTKLGLRFSSADRARLANLMAAMVAGA
jgi:glycerol-3-phosphate dehydrogenase